MAKDICILLAVEELIGLLGVVILMLILEPDPAAVGQELELPQTLLDVWTMMTATRRTWRR